MQVDQQVPLWWEGNAILCALGFSYASHMTTEVSSNNADLHPCNENEPKQFVSPAVNMLFSSIWETTPETDRKCIPNFLSQVNIDCESLLMYKGNNLLIPFLY